VTVLDQSWVGRKVKISPASSVYSVRAITPDGLRAFLSLVIDPKFVCTEPAANLIPYDAPKIECPICHKISEHSNADALHVRCPFCGYKITVWGNGGEHESAIEN
jgi:hypothetical protein